MVVLFFYRDSHACSGSTSSDEKNEIIARLLNLIRSQGIILFQRWDLAAKQRFLCVLKPCGPTTVPYNASCC